MKLVKFFTSLVALAVFLFPFALVLGGLAVSIYGLYLAFSASLIFGIIVFFIEPAPAVLGIAALLGHPELAKKIAELIGLA